MNEVRGYSEGKSVMRMYVPPATAFKVSQLGGLLLALSLVLSCGPSESEADAGISIRSDTSGTDGSDGCQGEGCSTTGGDCGDFYREPRTGSCVPCLEDSHCGRGVCHPSARLCVDCYDDEHCADGVCHPDGFFCVGCLADEHCSAGVCDPLSKLCVGCLDDAECDDGNMCTGGVCDDGKCRYPSVEDGTVCTGEVCTLEGVCAEGVCESGAPDPACTVCASNADCLDAEWCDFGMEQCAGEGTCVPRPEGCTQKSEEVCGCAGNTYDNPCMAKAAGEGVASYGACCSDIECVNGASPTDTNEDGCLDSCICKNNSHCDDGQACVSSACGSLGLCEDLPMCDSSASPPVCGCDGLTYANACAAGAANVGGWSAGPCCEPVECPEGEGGVDTDADGCLDTCSCTSGDSCTGDDFCVTSDGCGVSGLCMNCENDKSPVCGCDGLTWSDSCAAAKNDVKVASYGACACTPVTCSDGGKATDTDGDNCADACACSTTDDCTGTAVCAAASCEGSKECIPCVASTGPMCGCDHVTYSNACSAHSAGVAILYAGVCTCNNSADCGDSQYCAKDSCGSGSSGVCVACSAQESTVCGCDGLSYENACAATEAGAEIATLGSCGPCPELNCGSGLVAIDSDGDPLLCPDYCAAGCDSACDCYGAGPVFAGLCLVGETSYFSCEAGGCVAQCGEPPQDVQTCVGPDVCNKDADCGPNAYCARGFGLCGGTGSCNLKPSDCTGGGQEVCGCDGNNYANVCEAEKLGVSIEDLGSCCKVPTCGEGAKAADLDADGCEDECEDCPAMFCEANGLTTDTDGDGCPDKCVCPFEPTDCPDGQIPYDSDADGCADQCLCSIQLSCLVGTTPLDSDQDGCDDYCAPSTCAENDECGVAVLYCAKESGSCDAAGSCTALPTACPTQETLSPAETVCGCNGQTYPHVCFANLAGTSVASKGACLQ